MNRPVKFLLSRDDWYHQRGYWVVTTAVRNAGMEVILGGIQTPAEMVRTAVQEDVDIIGYRIMDAAPGVVIPILFAKMRENGIENIPVVVGGIVPDKDEVLIREMGVKEVFQPLTPLSTIVERVQTIALAARANRS
ncbi:MAG: cobalamin-dependent protein [Peptococcaceae bacterium]|nr:cobalamin-dependent protein [Peptococcaceae bacterium]